MIFVLILNISQKVGSSDRVARSHPNRLTYVFGYGIQESVMILDMETKTSYIVLDIVSMIQQKR